MSIKQTIHSSIVFKILDFLINLYTIKLEILIIFNLIK